MNDPIFNPIRINTLDIKNRIYLPAMHLGMAQDFEVTDQILNFYAQRARGGAGMICAGYATVDTLSGNTQNIGAHDDAFIPGLRRLATTIRKNGSRAAVQINHAGRYNFSFFLDGQQPVAPSPIASRMTRETPKQMTTEEIKNTIEAFGEAALRVQKAGFDAVEVLSGTGYLISEFLSPLTNQRTDEYGGNLENRMRFGFEVVRAVREKTGPDFPVIVRMNGNDFMPGGNSREELMEYARVLSGNLADALCINVGWHEARVPQIVASVPRGAFSYLAQGIRQVVTVPVIASHRVNDPTTARQLLNDGMCDMVAMGRSLIADPMLPEKTRQGREDEIIHCIGCAQGCFDNLFRLKHVECLCNPLAGHETALPLEKVEFPKKILVAGGGPAGMTAALAAASRGHKVTLYEGSDCLGGQLHLAAAPPGREEFAQLIQDLETQVRTKNIPIFLNTMVDANLVDQENPDGVILATGADPFVPVISGIKGPGIDFPLIVEYRDVLLGRVATGRRVAVIGGGAVGVETALFLAEKGTLSAEALKFLFVNRAEDKETLFDLATRGTREIFLIEMMEKVGKDIGKSTKWGMMQDLGRYHITTITGSRVIEITPKGLVMEQAGRRSEIQADTIVIAAGSVSNNGLESTLKDLNKDYRVVGDAGQVATAFEAIHQGHKAGMEI